MSSSIRLTYSGVPEVPPAGYARIFVGEFDNRLQLKMLRPDGTIEVFGTLNIPLDVGLGGTGTDQLPGIGQLLIGTGTGYRIGDITAGAGITITRDENTFEISTQISNIEIVMPDEFQVSEQTINGTDQFVVTKENQAPNTIYAGPTTAIENQPTFRLLVEGDIPQLHKYKIINFDEEIQTHIKDSLENSSNITLTYNNTTDKFKADLTATGVIAGSYGSLSAIPTIVVDETGRITSINNNIVELLTENITNFKESVEDIVGGLVKETDTIAIAYNDVLSELEISVKQESLITTNVSETENIRAPTSQAIKLYIDESIEAEAYIRSTEDSILSNKIDTFLENAPGVLDTIVEISQRFEAVEQAIIENAGIQAQSITNVYNAITAHREIISLTSVMLTQQIELQQVTVLNHIMPNSVVAFVDRIGLFEDLDFILANGPNNKVVLNLTPEARSLLEGNEVLRISYLTKI